MTRLAPRLLAATSALALLAACDYDILNRTEAGSISDRSSYSQMGSATENNYLIQTGQLSYAQSLADRFNKEIVDTVNFEFNSAVLDPQARQILDQQAAFIRHFPEVRFRVYGHTDKVGSNAYNRQLGLRRAQAVVSYLSSRGISRSRLEAMVSYGETRPLVQTDDPERRNRRTVTEVSGFVQDAPLVLNGKYAEIVFREYVASATSARGVGGGLSEL